jgi:hypothetical protein
MRPRHRGLCVCSARVADAARAAGVPEGLPACPVAEWLRVPEGLPAPWPCARACPQSPSLGHCLGTLDRMVNQNMYEEVAMDFKYWDDASDAFRCG